MNLSRSDANQGPPSYARARDIFFASREESEVKCPTCGSPDPRTHPAISDGGEVWQVCSDGFHLRAQMQGPITISQSYLIGSRNVGEIVIPMRMVLSPGGEVIVRCVALRDGGHGCDEEWTVGHMYGGHHTDVIGNILVHMEVHHACK